MISHKSRPIIFAIRTLSMLAVMKSLRSFKVAGWKYFFGGWGIFRVDDGNISLKPGTWIETGALLHAVSGEINIGQRTFINRGSLIVCRENISLGDDVLIGDYVSIYDHDHNFTNQCGEKTLGQSGYITQRISIGNNAWVGSHSVILKGVCIGKNSIVGAGSVVIRSIPDGEVWAGVPAKKIR